MPFKSQKQRALFYAKMNRGEFSPEMVKRWEEHTPKDKKLPKYVEKKAMITGFWSGFAKRAEENFVSANPTAEIPGSPEKMLKWNPHGGVDPRSPEDLQAAEAAGLITLPPDVEGASCGNCMYFRPITPELMHGFCTNPVVKQDVTAKMHCTGWSHPGSHDPVAAAQEEQQALQAEQAAMAQQGMAAPGADGQAMAGGNVNPANPEGVSGQAMAGGGDMAQKGGPQVQSEEGKPSPVGSVQGAPAPGPSSTNPLAQQALNEFQGEDTSGAPAGGAESPAEKPKEPSKPKKPKPKEGDKKSEGGKGNTINIHVGKDQVKTSKQDYWRGIFDEF